MELRSCGNSNLKLSPVGIGCWAFGGNSGDYWGAQDQSQVDALLKRATEIGLNYFDTAEAYNGGRSEESLGKALKGISRDKVVISSKVLPQNCHRDLLIASCEASLRRLQTDYIDLYLIHWPLQSVLLEDKTLTPASEAGAAEALLELQKQGKIRHIGVSNFGVEQLESFLRTGVKIVCNQVHYNLLSRAIELEVLPFCKKHGIGIAGYMPILQGILSGKFRSLDEIPENRQRTRHFSSKRTPKSRHGELGAEYELQEALLAIQTLSEKINMPMSQLAIRWSFSKPGITTSIVGARNVAQLEEAARAAEQPLSDKVVEVLDQVTAELKRKLGPSIDYFEHTDNERSRPMYFGTSGMVANS